MNAGHAFARSAVQVTQQQAPPTGWGMSVVIFGVLLAIAALVYRKWQKQQLE